MFFYEMIIFLLNIRVCKFELFIDVVGVFLYRFVYFRFMFCSFIFLFGIKCVGREKELTVC